MSGGAPAASDEAEELASALAQWREAAAAGRESAPRGVSILAAPGVGKSALLARLAGVLEPGSLQEWSAIEVEADLADGELEPRVAAEARALTTEQRPLVVLVDGVTCSSQLPTAVVESASARARAVGLHVGVPAPDPTGLRPVRSAREAADTVARFLAPMMSGRLLALFIDDVDVLLERAGRHGLRELRRLAACLAQRLRGGVALLATARRLPASDSDARAQAAWDAMFPTTVTLGERHLCRVVGDAASTPAEQRRLASLSRIASRLADPERRLPRIVDLVRAYGRVPRYDEAFGEWALGVDPQVRATISSVGAAEAAGTLRALALLELDDASLPIDEHDLRLPGEVDDMEGNVERRHVASLRAAGVVGSTARHGLFVATAAWTEWCRDRDGLPMDDEHVAELVKERLSASIRACAAQGTLPPAHQAVFSDGKRVHMEPLVDAVSAGDDAAPLVRLDLRFEPEARRLHDEWVRRSASATHLEWLLWLAGGDEAPVREACAALSRSRRAIRRCAATPSRLDAGLARRLDLERAECAVHEATVARAVEAAFVRGYLYVRGETIRAASLGEDFGAIVQAAAARFAHVFGDEGGKERAPPGEDALVPLPVGRVISDRAELRALLSEIESAIAEPISRGRRVRLI